MAPSRALRPAYNICATCLRRQRLFQRPFSTSLPNAATVESTIPRVASPSFWSSLIPKPFRTQSQHAEGAEAVAAAQPKPRSRFLTRPRDWNPYTIFILLALLTGSNAIQILSLKQQTLAYTRETEAKLELLREVVGKVKRGEDVDVRKVLGTGDEKAEREWEEVVRELEVTDGVEEGWRRKQENKRLKEEARAREGGGKREETKVVQPAPDDAHKVEMEGTEKRRPKYMM